MCGIVGAIAKRNVVPILLEGLNRLEYRGYDSAGVAVVNGKLSRLRSTGRVNELSRLAADRGLSGTVGIAHTRWATHGVPSERNAHPHISGGVCVVHNGIIENHDDVRNALLLLGYEFTSDTDTEVIAHLVHFLLSSGRSLFDAVQEAVGQLKGAYAIAVISSDEKQRMVVARMGAPLLLGLGEGENFAASDTSALLQVTRRIVYLEEGDCAEVTPDKVRIVDARGHLVERPLHVSTLAADAIELGSWRHYMQKEIFEQPAAVRATLQEEFEADEVLQQARSVLILACGTSFHAGLVARYWLEELTGLPCSVEIASEYRYRKSVADPRALTVVISQSGETADTIAALQHATALGQPNSLAICNVAESTIVRNARLKFLTRAGPEIGVASTKAFTAQLTALLKLTLKLSRTKHPEIEQALEQLPAAMANVLRVEPQIAAWAQKFSLCQHALFL